MMRKKYLERMLHTLLVALSTMGSVIGFSQAVFVKSAKIEFEKKENMFKKLGDNEWTNEMKKGKPEYQTTYFNLLFNQNESLFTPGKEVANPWANMWGSEVQPDLFIYTDYTNQTIKQRKEVFEATFLLNDSVVPIEWKIMDERRDIAGFECQKAIGRFYDTLYVVAFFCPQLVSSCGPQGYGGLPGMILGLAFPRFYTTWFATKVELQTVPVEMLVPKPKGKLKEIKRAEVIAIVNKAMKDWYYGDNQEERQRGFWQIVL